MTARALACCLGLAVAAAGCGDDEGESGASAGGKDGTALVAVPGPPGDGAALAERCRLPQPAPDAELSLPQGLAPSDAFVMSSEGEEARLVFRSSMRIAYSQMLANARRLGLTIERSELEGVDAELEVLTGDGRLALEFAPAGLCPKVSQATVKTERD